MHIPANYYYYYYSTLNTTLAKNYRPIAVGSIHAKLEELTMTPAADISDNQYGFRDGRGTGMACNLLNDIISHCKYEKLRCRKMSWHHMSYFVIC